MLFKVDASRLVMHEGHRSGFLGSTLLVPGTYYVSMFRGGCRIKDTVVVQRGGVLLQDFPLRHNDAYVV